MSLPQKQNHTIEDIYALPAGRRAELIDGQIYDMAPPKRIHQKLVNCIVNVFDFENNEKTSQYSIDNDISSCIFNDLQIKIANLL